MCVCVCVELEANRIWVFLKHSKRHRATAVTKLRTNSDILRIDPES